MKKIVLKGKVSGGRGGGSFFVSLPWARMQFKEKLGFDPYPGTLNLRLSPRTGVEKLKNATKGITIKPPEGFCKGRCFKALVMKKVWGAVVVPDIPNYSPDLLEVIAPVNLRKTLGLKDGMDAEVTIWLE